MDIERTIEFILQMQAKQAESQVKHVARMDTLDRRMDGVTKLLQQGMKILVSFQKETDRKFTALVDSQLRTDAALEQLAKAQKVTEQKLQRLIDRRSPNGH